MLPFHYFSGAALLDVPANSRRPSLKVMLEMFAVVDFEKGGGDHEDVPTTVGDESEIDGQTVVQLSASPGGGHDEMVWVRSEAPHRVVRMESTATRDGGTLAFAEFDEDVEVERPDPEDVLRP